MSCLFNRHHSLEDTLVNLDRYLFSYLKRNRIFLLSLAEEFRYRVYLGMSRRRVQLHCVNIGPACKQEAKVNPGEIICSSSNKYVCIFF